MVREEGGISSKVISSPSSKNKSLPTEKKKIQFALQFALVNKIEEPKYVFHVIPFLI